MAEIRVFAGGLTMMRAAAEYVVSVAEAAMSTRGHFSIALSGGATPKALYELLATDEFTRYIDWSFVRVFWGDERCVAPDHYDSNYRMAKDTLLEYVRIPVGNIYRIRGEYDPQTAADEYEKSLRSYFLRGTRPLSERQPRFDLVLLGIGEDGHTASLFPGTEALNEEVRWVSANYVEQLDTWRVTLTPSALNAAANVLFLVTGAKKAE
ncbi:MAG: 6-phosphogluconolactonase, partial [Burkholderiales bacterium]|nr:6-phosphogluconolactonase [Anaerolineae bacterium]